MARLRLLAALALAASLAACPGGQNPVDGGTGGGGGGGGGGAGGGGGGGGGGPVDAGPPGIPFGELCQNASTGFRNQYYEAATACGEPITQADLDHLYFLPMFQWPYTTVFAGSDCHDGGLANQMAVYQEAINAGRLGYDAQKAHECRALGRAYDGGNESLEPCLGVFFGKVPLNGACQADYECAGDAYCKPTNDLSCSGTCVPRLPADSPCSPIHSGCSVDTYCDNPDGGAYHCVGRADVDQPCGSDSDCKPNLVCLDNGTTGEVCTALAGADAGCITDSSGNHNCASPHVCVTEPASFTGVCMDRAKADQPCGSNDDGLPECASCLMCGDAGVCETLPMTGATCTADDECYDPQIWFCNGSGQCQVRPRETEVCIGDDTNGTKGNCMYFDNFCAKDAPGGAGTLGACKPLPKLGEACAEDAHNLSSICQQGFCKLDAGTCSPLAGLNDFCTNDSSVFGISPGCAGADQFCDFRPDAGAPSDTIGLCHTRLGVDSECDPFESYCADGLFCPEEMADGGMPTCTTLYDNGSTCTGHEQCKSALCDPPEADGGVRSCADLHALGTPCTDDVQCVSGICDPSSGVCTKPCGVAVNTTGGCMNYDLTSLSIYLFFAAIGVPFLRRWLKAKK